MKTYPVISTRSFDEWPADHPLRQLPIMPTAFLDKADVVVCTIKGEPRHPCGPGDSDVETTCRRCGVAVIHRASAPALPKECWRCFEAGHARL